MRERFAVWYHFYSCIGAPMGLIGVWKGLAAFDDFVDCRWCCLLYCALLCYCVFNLVNVDRSIYSSSSSMLVAHSFAGSIGDLCSVILPILLMSSARLFFVDFVNHLAWVGGSNYAT